jgi:hypothetical protein
MVARLVAVLGLLGVVGGGVFFLQRDPELRQRLATGLVDGLADALGVSRNHAQPEPTGRRPGKVALRKPGTPALPGTPARPTDRSAAETAPHENPDEEGPNVTPPARYVDRSPTPSALERVKPEDQKRLQDLIDQRAVAARPQPRHAN